MAPVEIGVKMGRSPAASDASPSRPATRQVGRCRTHRTFKHLAWLVRSPYCAIVFIYLRRLKLNRKFAETLSGMAGGSRADQVEYRVLGYTVLGTLLGVMAARWFLPYLKTLNGAPRR